MKKFLPLLLLTLVANSAFCAVSGLLTYDLPKPYFPGETTSNRDYTVISSISITPQDFSLQSYRPIDKYATNSKNFFHSKYAGFIIPAGLMTYGIVAQHNPLLDKFDHDIKSLTGKIFPGRTYIDDYLQYSPLVVMYGLQLCGVKSRDGWLNMTIAAATSYIVMTAAVNTIKYTAKVQRPDGSAFNSFPSGHTATAFVGAHLLYKEYKHISPWIGIAGYAAATATGIMRIMNRRHWFSDTMMGAGIGIASVEIGYLLLPLFDRMIKPKRNESGAGFCFTPVATPDYTGVGLAYAF